MVTLTSVVLRKAPLYYFEFAVNALCHRSNYDSQNTNLIILKFSSSALLLPLATALSVTLAYYHQPKYLKLFSMNNVRDG